MACVHQEDEPHEAERRHWQRLWLLLSLGQGRVMDLRTQNAYYRQLCERFSER
jgi:hypothetical protein